VKNNVDDLKLRARENW